MDFRLKKKVHPNQTGERKAENREGVGGWGVGGGGKGLHPVT